MTLQLMRFIVLVAALFPIAASAQVNVRVENPIAAERPDEVVSIKWSDLSTHLSGPEPGAIRVTDAATGTEVPSQVVDGNGDGTIDELIFLAGFWPHQSRTFRIEPHAPEATAPARVHVAYIPERDDVAWESDRIAFRVYGQGLWENPDYDPLVSSGVDVWLKRVDDLVIDRWYGAGHDAYHVDSGEGADFFSVGPTLGNGGNAVWVDGTMYPAENFVSQRILADGPVRAIFELTYEPWTAGSTEVSEVKRITIDAGKNLYREDVTFEFDGPDAIDYVVGFVKRAEGIIGSTRKNDDHAWLSVWGPVERKNGGHGKLGGGLLVDADAALEVIETEDHYLVRARARDGEPVTHYVGAGWTASGHFDGVEDWWQHLDALSVRLANPLNVRFAN